jgi:lysophospholipase L1-like esterase
MRMKLQVSLILLFLAPAFAESPKEHWVVSWTTAQPLIRPPAPPPRTAAPKTSAPKAVNPAQAINSQGFHDQTVRMIVHTSLGGKKLRIKFSSPFGGTPATIGGARVAMHGKDSEIVASSDHALTFNGKPGFAIGPGMVIISDPVDMAIPAQSDLAVSIYVPGESGPPPSHNSFHTTYISKEGDKMIAPVIEDPIKTAVYYWLAGIDVLAGSDTAAIVTFGDSITDGALSTVDTNRMWPAVLSARLSANKATARFAVANMGIGGNRVLRDGAGASALARFDRDVLSQAGVKWVMLLEGINDIGHGNTEPVTADELIGAFKQLIERAHTHGVKVVGCTLTPYGGAGYSREDGEAIRQALNAWIRTGGAFDAVVDFEAATRDSNDPKKIRADFDPGDHLHPNDAGYKAMADSIDLSIFTRKR